MRRKERGSIHHPVCLRPRAINNTLLVVSESICRSLAQFKAITTNKRNGTTHSLFQVIRAVTWPCEHSTLEAFSIHIYLTTTGDFIGVHNLGSLPLLQEKQQKPREPAPNSHLSCQQLRWGVLLKGTGVLGIRDGSQTAFSFVPKQCPTCNLLVASLHFQLVAFIVCAQEYITLLKKYGQFFGIKFYNVHTLPNCHSS